MFLLTDLNTTVSMLFMPLHLAGGHSQCTTNYTDITAAAGPGKFELSRHVLKMLIVVVVHQMIAISYVETDTAS